jgi:ketosteroid isomerase-like protein
VSADENTRLVQSAYEAFGRGDIGALAEVMADDIEWVSPGDPDDDPNAGTFKGKEAVLGWFGGLASTLDYTAFEPREFIAQNDKVVSLVYAEQRFGTPAARLSIMRHTCGRSAMGRSPDSRSITTPQRRLLPTAWSSPARGTGGSYVACATLLSPECRRNRSAAI